MDGLQAERSSLLSHLISIALSGLVLMGNHGALALHGDTTHPDVVMADEPTAPPRSTLFLYRLCGSGSAVEVSWCEGYLLGLADILLAMGNSRIAGGICAAEFDATALHRIFSSWAEHHPERLSDDMAMSAQASFREVWPCQ